MIMLLTACAATIDHKPLGDRELSPLDAAEGPELLLGRVVEWGGVLVDSRNLRAHSELEILAYPLRSNGLPDRGRRPRGRFLAVQPGYLETAEYAPGRLVTISGPLAGRRQGQVGEARYQFPLVEIEQATLWQDPYPSDTGPRVHFGIGGGSRGSNVGVGIGF